jgi:hypothetical protein
MTNLEKPIARPTRSPFHHYRKRIVVSLEPRDLVGKSIVRQLSAVFITLRQWEVDAKTREKKLRRKSVQPPGVLTCHCRSGTGKNSALARRLLSALGIGRVGLVLRNLHSYGHQRTIRFLQWDVQRAHRPKKEHPGASKVLLHHCIVLFWGRSLENPRYR